MTKISDIKVKIKIIEFLGFNVSNPDKNENYKITDAKGNKVGFIKYDKCQYYTQIENEELFVESGVKDVDFPDSPLNMNIYFKKIYTDVNIQIEANHTAIKMHLADNKILKFYIDKNRFYFVCKEPYNNSIEQCVEVNSVKKTYFYNISFVDIRDKEHNYPLYEGQLECQPVKQSADLMEIKNTWPYWRGKRSNNHKPDYISTFQGTIEDIISKQQMGIDAFNRMRYLMNTIQFNKEIIDFIIQNTQFELPMYLDLFVPEIKNQNKIKSLIK